MRDAADVIAQSARRSRLLEAGRRWQRPTYGSSSHSWQLVRNAYAQQRMVTRVRETDACGGLDRHPRRHVPSDDGRKVVTLFGRREAFSRPQSAIGFDANDEVLGAE